MFSAVRFVFVIFILLWVAFTILRIGLTMLCQTCPSYLMGTTVSGDVSCPDSFHNAMALVWNDVQGDWGYDGLMTDLFCLYFIVFWMFNIVLMNLLIAVMAAQFEKKMEINDREWVIDRYVKATQFSCWALVVPPLAPLILLIEGALFVWHYRSLRHMFPGCPWRTRLWLHITRSNAHEADLEFSWLRGVYKRQSCTVLTEVNQLQCFLENARRKMLATYFPSQQHIQLSQLGGLNSDVSERIKLEQKMDMVSDTVMGSLDRMSFQHSTIFANREHILEAQSDVSAGVKEILHTKSVPWTQQAVAGNKHGFFLDKSADFTSGFGASAAFRASTITPRAGFGKTLDAHGGVAAAASVGGGASANQGVSASEGQAGAVGVDAETMRRVVREEMAKIHTVWLKDLKPN